MTYQDLKPNPQHRMGQEINERLVKISAGLVPIEGDLKLGDDVQILVSGNVVKTEHKDNQDGTYDLVFIVKGLIAYVNEEATD